MKLTSKYLPYLLLASICFNKQVFAQDTLNVADINYVFKSNALLNSKNAAALTSYTAPNLTDASVYFIKENGGFKNYFQAKDSRTYGLQAQSLTKLNSKIVFSGGFGYENFLGKNMSGSAFVDPYKAPFDIVELNPDNAGDKHMETYQVNGAVGAALHPKLSVGARLNYLSANYAKRKDLRHTNKLLNMDFSAGFMYKLTSLLELGASYDYNRRIESISFNRYGNTDKEYLSLISYGAFYGRSELFGDYGYTGNTNPLKDIKHGASVQLNIKFNNNVKLFNEFSFADRNGFFGTEGTSSILLTQHTGKELAYRGHLSFNANRYEHQLAAKFSYNYLANKETIYRRTTSVGGINEIVYYGNRDVFNGETLTAGLSYDLFADVENSRSKWELHFSADYRSRDNAVSWYPFYRDQKNERYEFAAHFKKQFQIKKEGIKVGLGLGYGAGTGQANIDGVVVEPAADYVQPVSMPVFLNEEFEYFTASRFKGEVSLQYTKPLPNNIGAYLNLNYGLTYAPNAIYLGKQFSHISLALGCNF